MNKSDLALIDTIEPFDSKTESLNFSEDKAIEKQRELHAMERHFRILAENTGCEIDYY